MNMFRFRKGLVIFVCGGKEKGKEKGEGGGKGEDVWTIWKMFYYTIAMVVVVVVVVSCLTR